MLKPVIIAAAMIILAGSSITLAQQGSDAGSGTRHRSSAEDMAAFTDARIAALRAGLQLTPDQAKNWPAFEQALRDAAQLRMQRMQAREARGQSEQPSERDQAPANPFARLERRADNLAQRSAALKKVADAGAPLYQSLTDAQKGRFTILARMLRPHWLQMGGGMMGSGMMGRGMRGSGMMGHGMMGGGMMDRGMMDGDSDQDSER